MTCEQENYIQQFKDISLSMDDALAKLRVPSKRLHHDGMGGLVVGPERKGRGVSDGYLIADKIGIGSDGCWKWKGTINSRSYGVIGIAGKRYLVHRALFSLLFGSIPTGFVVRHKCDNPSCCNPFHLEPGTQKDNIGDMITRGRGNFVVGVHNGKHKLCPEQIVEIRFLAQSGMSQQKIAERFSASTSNIESVVNRKTWKSIP
jgi:hypothetical protein